jgi:hypothetical protein
MSSVEAAGKLKMPKSPRYKSTIYEAIFPGNWVFLQRRYAAIQQT